jgi:hypothetical protein
MTWCFASHQPVQAIAPIGDARTGPHDQGTRSAWVCGSEFHAEDSARGDCLQLESDDTGRIPVVFHVIRDDFGGGGYQPVMGDVDTELAATVQRTNGFFEGPATEMGANAGQFRQFVFFVDRIMDGQDRESHRAREYLQISDGNRGEIRLRLGVPNKLNVFLVDDITLGGEELIAGFSSWPGSEVQGIVLDWRYLVEEGRPSSLLAHEIGHHFFLMHTHERAIFGRELVTRDPSNCESRGDKLCDTPADPGYGFRFVNPDSCAYVIDALDPTGVPYAPDPQNIMSTAPMDCASRFTLGQLERMTRAFNHEIVGQKAPNLPPEIDVLTFPNPAGSGVSQLAIRFETPGGFTFGELNVYDALGRLVRTMSLGWVDGYDMSQLAFWDRRNENDRIVPTGTYFVRVRLSRYNGAETTGHSSVTIVK